MIQIASDERKEELLRLARQSRIKWVLDAREIPRKPVEDLVEKKVVTSNINVPDALKAKIPASECVQKVLNFLSELKNDGECFDVQSIALGIVDDDENDQDLIEFMKNAHTFSSADMKDTIAMYNMFIKKLVHPSSTEIVKAIQQYVTKFTSNVRAGRSDNSGKRIFSGSDDILKDPLVAATSVKSSEIWSFLDKIYEMMRASTFWSDESEYQFEQSKGYCEKFLFIKLHSLIFGSDLEDSYNNQKTRERIESLGFLTAEHLDIKCLKNSPHYAKVYQQQQQHFQQQLQRNGANATGQFINAHDNIISHIEQVLLSKPIAALKEIESAKCPTDKLQCVKNCTMAIAQILKECSRDGKASGTDEFLPLLILVVRSCNPLHIHSNLKYLQRYTRPAKLISEAGYLLTNFVSAVHFLDNVDSKALTIEPDEFDRAIARSRAVAKERNRLMEEAANNSISSSNNSGRKVASDGSGGAAAAGEDGEVDEDGDTDALLSEYHKALNSTKKQAVFVSVGEVSQRRRQFA